MRPIEFNAAMIRTQDISSLRQADDSKPMVDQQTMMQSSEKVNDARQETVHETRDEDMDSEYDASQGGNGAEYEQSEHKKKKEEDPDGVVVVKGRATFDVKI